MPAWRWRQAASGARCTWHAIWAMASSKRIATAGFERALCLIWLKTVSTIPEKEGPGATSRSRPRGSNRRADGMSRRARRHRSDVVWMVLKEADVDAKDRKIIWQDRQRLSFAGSVKRIHADYPDFAIDLIEDHLIGWLEMGFAPPSYSQEQLDGLDQLTEMWVEDHRR